MKMISLNRTRMYGLVVILVAAVVLAVGTARRCAAQSSPESKQLEWKRPNALRETRTDARLAKTPVEQESNRTKKQQSQDKAAASGGQSPPGETKDAATGGNEASSHDSGLPSQPSGQPPRRFHPGPEASGVDLILEAYEASKVASSELDFSSIIELCEEGLIAKASDETKSYAHRLLSWAYNRRGELVAASGSEGQATLDFEAAVRHDKTRWRAYHNRGVSRALAGRHGEAIADFNRTIQINPTYANAYFNRGEVKYELGDFASALGDYDRAIHLAPDDSPAHNSRGHTYYQLGKVRNAAADFTEAVSLDPDNAAAYANRGEMYADLGYYPRALHDFRKAVEIDPQLGSAYQGIAWVLATCRDPRYRDPKAALIAANRAIELDGEASHHGLDTLAAVYASRGEFGLAKEVLAQAIDLAPQDVTDQYQVRLALYEEDQPFVSQPRPIPPIRKKQPARRVRP